MRISGDQRPTNTLKHRKVPMSDLPDWARRLDLAPHPEGGYFRETWRSDLTVTQSALPADYTGPRSAGTAILFLLLPGQQSAWHPVGSTTSATARKWLLSRRGHTERNGRAHHTVTRHTATWGCRRADTE